MIVKRANPRPSYKGSAPMHRDIQNFAVQVDDTSESLSDVFPDGVAARTLHFLVKLPPGARVSFVSLCHLIFTAPCAGIGLVLGS
jgi:hypothetical protein